MPAALWLITITAASLTAWLLHKHAAALVLMKPGDLRHICGAVAVGAFAARWLGAYRLRASYGDGDVCTASSFAVASMPLLPLSSAGFRVVQVPARTELE